MTLREKIEVMQAFELGEEVERRDRLNDTWFASKFPAWNWKEFEYRIKPKPKQVVVIEKWLLKHKTKEDQYAIEEGNAKVMETWGTFWSKVKIIDTYEVEI